MYRVFLVEDESLIRQGIKNLIPWDDYGFFFAGEAADGELAWQQIQKETPDIVITDIRMPFMDGLELSRLIKRNFPQVTVIILSGYDDFSYAKEAIGIGVEQYLLKPLTREQLTEVLLEVKKKKEKEQEKLLYMEQFSREVQEYMTSSHRGFFEALVSGKYVVSELLERAERLGIHLNAEAYNIILLLIEDEKSYEKYRDEGKDYQAELYHVAEHREDVDMFWAGVELVAFLIKSSKEEIVETTEAFVQELEQMIPSSIAYGKPEFRLSMVNQCYQSARKKLFHVEESMEEGRNEMYTEEEMKVLSSHNLDASKVDQRIFEKFLANGLQSELNGFVEDYFDSLGENALKSFLFRQYMVMHIMFTVKSFLEKLNMPKEIVKADITVDSELFDAFSSIESTKEYTQRIMSRALEVRDQTAQSKYSTMMDKVIQYLKENFANHDITLSTVANVANVSAPYFSGVFSQQMGKTFVEYLTELRMEQARELLRCTDKSSGEIAYEVGYNDSHYFSFLFKKVNGCSPRDYRGGKRNHEREAK